MFMMSDEAVAAVQAAYQKGGEWAAVVELRRHFPLITGNEQALWCVRIITGWRPPLPKGC